MIRLPLRTIGAGLMITGAALLYGCIVSHARDDGRYAQSLLKSWFDSLRSSKGYCCSDADGRETQYDIRDGHYWLPLSGDGKEWTQVPDEAVITEPNKMGRPMVWLGYVGCKDANCIRCFIPGSGI